MARARAGERLAAVVALLRERGKVAEHRARIFLWALLALVALGLGYYVLRPLAQTYFDGVRRTWADQAAVWSRESAKLDTEREALRGRLVAALSPAAVPVHSGTVQRLTDLLFVPGGKYLPVGQTIVATGADGAITRSTDAGASWIPVKIEGGGYLARLNIPGQDTIIMAGSGGITYSPDGGGTWMRPSSTANLRLGSLVNIPGSETVVAVGADGAVVRSTDGGENWIPVPSGTGQSLGVLLHLPGGETLVASGGAIIRSTDGGANWTPIISGTNQSLGSLLHIPGSETLVAAGSDGAIVRSTDSGASWSPVGSGTRQDLYTLLQIPGSDTIVAAGYDGSITRSNDGGATWSVAASGTTDPLQFLLWIPDGEILIAWGWGDTITRSTDGGTSWTPVATGGRLQSIVNIPSSRTLFAVGMYGMIVRSADGGANWTQVASGTHRDLEAIVRIPSSGTLIAAGDGGAVVIIDDQLARSLAALVVSAGPEGDTQLGAWIDQEVPVAMNDFPAVQASRSEFSDIVSRRRPVQAALATAERELEARRRGTSTLADRQAAFETFMSVCRSDAGPDDDSSATRACAEAWAAAERDDVRSWWALLAEQVPPGILLLFLLSTLSGLYRYNVRLAGFHHGRADALELLAGGSPADLTALADALAADKVEFGAAKTPTDHAAEMATALINRSKP